MKTVAETKVFQFDLPPYPREGLFHLDMSPHCQVNRLLTFEAGRLAQLHQLDVFKDIRSLRRFQKEVRAKLWEKFGVKYDRSLPLDVKEYGIIREKDFTIRKLIYQSQPGVYVTGLLYVPKGKGPFPAVLQMHGHNKEGKFGKNPQSTSLDLVKSGYVCFTVDAFGTYERGYQCYEFARHGGFQGASVLNLGQTLMGLQVVDNMRGVDLLCSLPYVIKDRIGATGASGGGNQTMWLSAMDERIAAAMPVVSVGSFESYVYGMNCVCELLPDGLHLTEEAGILALIAPRPLRIGNALYDCNQDFSVAEMLKTYHAVEKIYWNLGYPERISFTVADRIHGMHDRQRESVLGHFAQFLKGEGNGNPIPEPDFELYPEQKLYLFPDPAKRPDKVVSIPTYCERVGKELRKAYLARKKISRKESISALKEMLHLQDLPAQTLYRYEEMNGVGRCALEIGNHVIPFLVKPGKQKGLFRILLHPQGKGMLSDADLQKAGKDGATLILPDLFGTGETAQPNHTIALHHQFFRQLMWVGRTLVGEWVFDILALARMLKKDFKAKTVSVTGLLETGDVALFANVFSKDIDDVVAQDSPASLLFDHRTIQFTLRPFTEPFLPGGIYSPALCIHGFLQWGDISLAAALGNGAVQFVSPRASDGTKYSKKEIRSFAQEIEKTIKKLV